jgi:hypothetical protein
VDANGVYENSWYVNENMCRPFARLNSTALALHNRASGPLTLWGPQFMQFDCSAFPSDIDTLSNSFISCAPGSLVQFLNRRRRAGKSTIGFSFIP